MTVVFQHKPELEHKKILLLAGPDFEDRELFYPLYRFQEAGATVKVAGIGETEYKGKYGVPLPVDDQIEVLAQQHWDVVIIPGGWAPDKIRMNQAALDVVRKTLDNDAIVGAICHGGWVLTSANVVQGRKVTSFVAIKDDMVHAGAQWVDEEVVIDKGPTAGHLVTARKPADLPAFCAAIIALAKKVPIAV